MKVLGKVVVPKPLNLPSQRLENHGLDPNVEIVPKGTLSWGNRSSSASNPWGSQMLSPSADGGSSSPRSHSGRPSSGGSGTRPSTAGSDRAHELTGNAWGPNSRPSSASGALTSNQTALTSLRPRSAETRPGSSHLSRFAESSTENLVAWGSAGTAEKLGVASSKKDGFSLSSGDFPTLGSEKDNSTTGIQSQDHGSHGRPGSSSGGGPPVKERTGAYPVDDVPANANVNSGSVNAFMRRDNSPYMEDGARSNVEKWQGEPQHYQNANMPPQHFDHWPGAPVGNSQGGVWYRGPPGGPPYATPVAPGGFPMEPYPYYRPQIPATALANSQPVPPPGVGPRGHHPRGHHMPDAYIRPGMPIRPGFYPGPVAYESYYAPPMGYCNPSDRDIQYMGMAAGPPVYNCYPGHHAPDSNNSNGRSGGFGPTGKPLVPEQRESGHPPDPQGQYKVLLKQHNNLDGKEEESNWEHTATNNESLFEKGDQPRMSALGSDRRADRKNDEQMGSRRNAVDTVSPVHVKVSKSESLGNAKEGDDGLIMKIENARLSSAEVLATSKDSTLIQKIESLNAKARASDVRHDFSSVSSRDEQKNRCHVHAKGTHSAIEANTGGVSHERSRTNSKGVHSANEASTGGAAHERTYTNVKGAHSAIEASTTGASLERTYTGKIYTPGSSEVGTASGEISFEPAGATALPRRATHAVQGPVDHRGKGRSNAQEIDGWRKKSSFADTSSVVLAPNSEAANIQVQDLHASMEAAEKSVSSLDGKDEEEDIQAQRAKMRELAKQRAQQLQREEEERTREQKAKALAKLEELNRRTLAVDGSTQKLENVPPSGAKQEEFQTLAEPIMSTSNVGAPDKTLVSNPNVVAQNIEISTTIAVESSISSKESPKIAGQESVVVDKQSSPLQEDLHNADAAKKTSTPPDNSSASKLKRMGYKQKHNVPLEKSSTEVPKSHIVVAETADAVVEVIPSSVASNPNVSSETSVHQRRKNYKNGRNKHKQEERSSATSPLSPVPRETNTAKVYELELDLSTGNGIQSSEQRLSDEAHGRVNNNNQWKSQNNIRRLPRNQQANNKLTEKFQSGEAVIWAPVRSHNKSEVSEEAVHKSTPDETIAPTLKNKRAEMERYVPKPVANQQIPDENIGSQIAESSQPGVSKGGFKNVEGKQSNNNKQGKAQGWRQRNSNPSNVHGFQDGTLFTSKPSKNEEESIEHHHDLKPAVDEWDDGWNMPPPPPPPVNSEIPVAKDQGQTGGRGKRQSYKGQKGNNQDFDRKNNIDAEKTFETSEIDRNVGSKENHGFGGERASSHWQPKSGYYNQRGSNRQTGGQNVIRQKNDKEMTSEGTTRVQHEQFKFEKGIIGEAPHTGNHSKRGRKPQGQSPNQGSVSHVEPAPPAPIGEPFRKNGNQNNRSSLHGDWSQDGRQQNVGGNRERQRSNNPNNNSHYEYQPVGPYNKSSNFGGSTDGSDNNTRSRFRERGGGGQKRGGGNSYGRQSGSVRVDAVYD